MGSLVVSIWFAHSFIFDLMHSIWITFDSLQIQYGFQWISIWISIWILIAFPYILYGPGGFHVDFHMISNGSLYFFIEIIMDSNYRHWIITIWIPMDCLCSFPYGLWWISYMDYVWILTDSNEFPYRFWQLSIDFYMESGGFHIDFHMNSKGFPIVFVEIIMDYTHRHWIITIWIPMDCLCTFPYGF